MSVWRAPRAGVDGTLCSSGVADVPLNTVVEFDSPFAVLLTRDGGVLVLTGGDVPEGTPYAPTVTMLADGSDHVDSGGWGDQWEPVDGYSGQHGYAGPVMHASEQLAGGMAADVLSEPGTYVIVAVETDTCDDFTIYGECGVSSPPAKGDTVHKCTGEPAGWMLLKLVSA